MLSRSRRRPILCALETRFRHNREPHRTGGGMAFDPRQGASDPRQGASPPGDVSQTGRSGGGERVSLGEDPAGDVRREVGRAASRVGTRPEPEVPFEAGQLPLDAQLVTEAGAGGSVRMLRIRDVGSGSRRKKSTVSDSTVMSVS